MLSGKVSCECIPYLGKHTFTRLLCRYHMACKLQTVMVFFNIVFLNASCPYPNLCGNIDIPCKCSHKGFVLGLEEFKTLSTNNKPVCNLHAIWYSDCLYCTNIIRNTCKTTNYTIYLTNYTLVVISRLIAALT